MAFSSSLVFADIILRFFKAQLVLFIERNVRLVRDGALVAMIVPNTLLRQRRIKDVRAFMLQNRILTVVDLGEDVFTGVVAPSCIFVLEKAAHRKHQVQILNLSKMPNVEKARLLESGGCTELSVDQRAFRNNADLEFMIPLQRLAVPAVSLGNFSGLKCRDAGINYQRVKVGMQEKGKSDLSKRLLYTGKREKAEDKMYWKGADINRYWIANATERFCRPDYQGFIRPNEVVRLNEHVFNTAPKILLRQTADHIIATIDDSGVWFGRSIIALLPAPQSSYRIEYFLGLLNSQYFRSLYTQLVQ